MAEAPGKDDTIPKGQRPLLPEGSQNQKAPLHAPAGNGKGRDQRHRQPSVAQKAAPAFRRALQTLVLKAPLHLQASCLQNRKSMA